MNKIQDIIKRFYQSNNIKNSLWIIGEQVFQMALALLVGMFSARYLGPEDYGTLNYTASFVSFFSCIASLSMEGVVIRKLVDNPQKEGIYLGSCIVFRLISSAFSTISIAIIVFILNPGDMLKLQLVTLQSLQLFFKGFNLLDIWFQRYLKSKYTSIGKMIASIVVALYRMFLLITSKSIIWFAISSSLSDLVIGSVLYIFYKVQNGPALEFCFRYGLEVLSESYHFILSDMMAAIYKYMDKIMIGQMMSDSDVGFYVSATTISSVWAFIPMAIINSYRPTIMEIKNKGNKNLYTLRLKQLFSVVIWISIAFAVMISLFSYYIIYFLYGKDYLGAVNALRIIVWAEAFAIISTARSIWILCENKNKYVKHYVVIGMLVNIIFNFVLIPVIGIEGAAIATLFTEFVVLIIAPLMFKETRESICFILDGFLLKWFITNKRGF